MSTHIQRDYWPTMGWRESSPEEQGMDPKVLSGLDTYIAETRPYLNTLLIARHGRIVFERSTIASTPSSYQVLNSATKSIVSALIGIALQVGDLKSLEQRWEELLAEYFTAKSDRR